VVIASCALIAGHVEIEDDAFISGGVVVHQYSKIGRLAMIAGNVRVNQDAPPFFLYASFDIEPHGVNLVGLRRAGFPADRIAAIRKAYKVLYSSNLKLNDALSRIETEEPTSDTRHLVEFIRRSKRGIPRPRRAG
jgi:UDP-N-acetylglucosamine acyltransferase